MRRTRGIRGGAHVGCIIWLVILAMAVRNSLMNAGNPIASAFAMDRVSVAERATLAASMSLLWSVGWVFRR